MKPMVWALVLAGAAGLFALKKTDDVDPVAVGSIAPSSGSVYELSHGYETCLLHRIGTAKKGTELVDYGCKALLPSFDEGLHWAEGEEGTVAFVTKAGRVVVEFGLADGEGYESYSPREPILTLIERP